MARKQAGGKKMPMPATAEAKTKPVRLDLKPDVHRLLRVLAADSEMSMAAYARDSLERCMRDEAKRKGIKT